MISGVRLDFAVPAVCFSLSFGFSVGISGDVPLATQVAASLPVNSALLSVPSGDIPVTGDVPPKDSVIPVESDAGKDSEDDLAVSLDNPESLLAGGVDSLAMIAIGAAEGTRLPTGETTAAFGSHKDPGNGKENKGTCSWQATAVASAEEGDARCMERIKKDITLLLNDAYSRGMVLNLEEFLNALDLANQAPAAALTRGGYLDRLQEARQMGLQGDAAISWARVRSYLDPDTLRWNAPGLGNREESITADQERRMREIKAAMEAQL